MTAPWAGNAFGARHTFGTDPEGGKEAPEKNSNANDAFGGVADGIRTHNNRNHKAMEAILEAAGINKIKDLRLERRRKIG
jgi:hypothetical protein